MLQLHMIPTSGDVTLLRFYEEKDELNVTPLPIVKTKNGSKLADRILKN